MSVQIPDLFSKQHSLANNYVLIGVLVDQYCTISLIDITFEQDGWKLPCENQAQACCTLLQLFSMKMFQAYILNTRKDLGCAIYFFKSA